MKIQETYTKWRSSIKRPDDSLFYYHPSLNRILLGLAIYVIGSQQLASNLGNTKSLTLLHIYVKDLITAWIDEDKDAFETMFGMTMVVAEAFMMAALVAASEYPSKKKDIRKLQAYYAHAISIGGDMSEKLAKELLDDLYTDGDRIYSDKIASYGANLLRLTSQYGIDIPPRLLRPLLGR